jgi:hypothetical protein
MCEQPVPLRTQPTPNQEPHADLTVERSTLIMALVWWATIALLIAVGTAGVFWIGRLLSDLQI